MPVAVPLAANDIVEASMRGYYMNQRILTVLHYRWLGGALIDGTTELIGLLNRLNMATGVFALVRDCQSSAVGYVEYRVQVIYPTRGVYLSQSVSDSGSRTVSNPLPANDCAVITKRVGTMGRGRSGSIHVCGIGVADQSNGELTSGFKSIAQPLADHVSDYEADLLGTLVWEPVTWSRSVPASPAIVFDGKVEDQVRVMRRRTVGVGE